MDRDRRPAGTHVGPGLLTGPHVFDRGFTWGSPERGIRGDESSPSGRTPGWRWRESNPRPTTHHQGFSERSPLCLCSTLPIARTRRDDRPSRCEVSRECPRPALTVSHLADARIRADDEPGLTESPRYLGSEGELALTGVGACVVSDAWLTSSSSASSARFPWSPDRSRDRSPPVQLCTHRNRPGQAVVPAVPRRVAAARSTIGRMPHDTPGTGVSSCTHPMIGTRRRPQIQSRRLKTAYSVRLTPSISTRAKG